MRKIDLEDLIDRVEAIEKALMGIGLALTPDYTLQAENKRLRSELKAAGKGAERNAHINVMLVDENKRLQSQIKQQDTETIPEEVDNGT